MYKGEQTYRWYAVISLCSIQSQDIISLFSTLLNSVPWLEVTTHHTPMFMNTYDHKNTPLSIWHTLKRAVATPTASLLAWVLPPQT